MPPSSAPGQTVARTPLPCRRLRVVVTAPVLLLLVASGVRAQDAPATSPSPTVAAPEAKAPSPAAPDSPRASLRAYLEAGRGARWEKAASFLELAPGEAAEGPELARRLKAVLDRHVWFDLDEVSGDPDGNAADGLPPGVDEIARIRDAKGQDAPVRLVKRGAGEEAAWLFSSRTVARVDGWYGEIPGRWALELLPEPLLRPGPGEILWWQWAAIPLLVLLSWLLALPLRRLTVRAMRSASGRTETTWDDVVIERLRSPILDGWLLGAFALLLPLLQLYEPAHELLRKGIRALALILVVWTAERIVDVVESAVGASRWALERKEARALVRLGARVLKVLILGVAAVTVLALLGYPVASILAGLGLGGLAFALAAQKTVENLFGAFSIAVDRPLREGDFVKVDDVLGTVEAVGLRSTRLRTLDRTLVTIPNGQLADMRIESLTERDRLRLATTIGLVYETTEAQMRQVLEGFEGLLRSHPKIWPEVVVVRFSGFAASSLDIEVACWFQTTDWLEFLAIRQEVLLGFMGIVESAGSSMAFPTRTVHLVAGGATPPPGTEKAA